MKVRSPRPHPTARASAYPARAGRRAGRPGSDGDFDRARAGPEAAGPGASEGGESRRRCRHGCGRGPELGLVPEAGRPGRPEGLHCHGAGEGEGRQRGPLPAGAGPSGLIPDAQARPVGPGAAGPGAA